MSPLLWIGLSTCAAALIPVVLYLTRSDAKSATRCCMHCGAPFVPDAIAETLRHLPGTGCVDVCNGCLAANDLNAADALNPLSGFPGERARQADAPGDLRD